MTDLEKLKALLNEWGVPFEEEGFFDETCIDVKRNKMSPHPKVGGYDGFLTRFTFNLAGSFLEMGAYE